MAIHVPRVHSIIVQVTSQQRQDEMGDARLVMNLKRAVQLNDSLFMMQKPGYFSIKRNKVYQMQVTTSGRHLVTTIASGASSPAQ